MHAGLLGERDFALLFAARTTSAFGSAMAPVAMAFGVLELTGSAAPMGFVIASQTLALLLFQLVGGTLADRGSRRTMMIRADGIAMLSQVTMALLFLTGRAEVPWLAALMAANGIALALHGPSAMGLVPLVVPSHRLQQANALIGAGQNAAMALGVAGAGVLVATIGPGWALAVDASSFAASAGLIYFVRVRTQARAAAGSLLLDLRDGWREFTAHRWLWTIVLQFSIMLACWEATFSVIGPTVAKRFLGGATDWGWIAGSLGLGSFCGALIAMRLQVERPMLVATLMCFGFCLPPLLLIGPAPVWLIACGAFVTGMCVQSFGVLWNTTVQREVAPEALSRVSAYDHLGSTALAPLGIAAAGVILEAVGTGPTLWGAAALIVVPTLAVLSVPEVRSLRDSHPRETV